MVDDLTAVKVVPLRVVFLSEQNACCSQMAQALARMIAGEAVIAQSAGSQPASAISAKAIASMASIGYDLTRHQPQPIAALPAEEFDAAVTVSNVSPPAGVRARLHEHWRLPDPGQLSPIDFDLARDMIGNMVRELLVKLAQARVNGDAGPKV